MPNIIMRTIKFFQVRKSISGMLKQGRKEILNGQIMIEFYKWQKSIAPKDAAKEDIGKIDLKIKQMQDIIANNQRLDTAFRAFLRAQ